MTYTAQFAVHSVGHVIELNKCNSILNVVLLDDTDHATLITFICMF